VKTEYQEQMANGSGGPKTEMKWDIPAGKTA